MNSSQVDVQDIVPLATEEVAQVTPNERGLERIAKQSE